MVGLAVVISAAGAEASRTIAANSSVVTHTNKNAFRVRPSSPNATQVYCPSNQVKALDRFICTAIVDGLKVPVSVQVLDTVPLTVNATPQEAVLSLDRSEGALEAATSSEPVSP